MLCLCVMTSTQLFLEESNRAVFKQYQEAVPNAFQYPTFILIPRLVECCGT